MSIVKFTNGKFPVLNINGTKKLIDLPSTVLIGDKKYKTIKIGSLLWISENLDYIDEQFYTTYNQYEPTALKINGHDEYGKYYNYYGRQRIRDILPEGWRVPTSGDFNNLINAVGSNNSSLLRTDTQWSNPGLNTLKFNAYPSGYINYFSSQQEVGRAFYCESYTNRSGNRYYQLVITDGDTNNIKQQDYDADNCFPIRVCKNAE